MSDGINLIASKEGHSYSQLLNKLRVLRLVAVSSLFLIATSSMVLFLIIAFSPLPRLKAEEQQYMQTLNVGEYRSKWINTL